ncbi:MAG TPA: Uma2 family endonuclease [Pirellulaceae bacterium]|jgi:Uma2 family endonuclease
MIQRAPIAPDLVDYETYRVLVPDGEKADLIDGVIYMASPDTKLNNSLNLFLAHLIDGFTTARNIDGFTFLSRFSCKITEFRAPEPDVGYVKPERGHLVEERHMVGGPDIAVEIVSRDSRQRDYGEKRGLYQDAGVTEYWIIDPLQSRVEFLGLKEGRYELLPLEENRIFRSTVIPGFWLDVNWLLSKPVPRAYRCLQQILGDKKKKSAKRKR